MLQVEDNQEETMFMLFTAQNITQEDTWFLDSGCMTGNRDLFTTLKDSEKKKDVPVMTNC